VRPNGYIASSTPIARESNFFTFTFVHIAIVKVTVALFHA
jgi:hypothetical protein